MKSAFWDKLVQRLDRVDPGSLQTYVLRLAREHAFLESLFDAIQEGIVVLGADGTLDYINRGAQELLGIPAEASAEGAPVNRYLRGLDWEELLGPGAKSRAGTVTRELEVFYPRHRYLSFYIIPVADAQGAEGSHEPEEWPALPLGEGPDRPRLALIVRDVTEARRRTEDVIQRESLSAITLLSAGVAHEIGNPLNSLHIHLQLMDRELRRLEPAAAEPVRELVQVAKENVARLNYVVTQFLGAVRPTTPQRQPTNLAQLVDETLRSMAREIADRDILVEQERGEDIPLLQLDPDRIRQALFNIIKNALQAMPDGGILRLQIGQERDWVVLSVADNGSGIRPEDMSRIFEPYWTTKPTGSGLGLMIVHRIVSEHGGEIDVQSVPQQGTVFRIRLPTDIRRLRLLRAGGDEDAPLVDKPTPPEAAPHG